MTTKVNSQDLEGFKTTIGAPLSDNDILSEKAIVDYVDAEIAAVPAGVRGGITGTLTDQTDLTTKLGDYVPYEDANADINFAHGNRSVSVKSGDSGSLTIEAPSYSFPGFILGSPKGHNLNLYSGSGANGGGGGDIVISSRVGGIGSPPKVLIQRVGGQVEIGNTGGGFARSGDTTLFGNVFINNPVSTAGTVVSTSGVQTLTNKRINPRVTTEVSSATPTINTDTTDLHRITALADDITSMTTNLTGTPVDGQKLIISITDDGTARTIARGAGFEASTIALPTTTVISERLDVEFIWNTVTSKWRCILVA